MPKLPAHADSAFSYSRALEEFAAPLAARFIRVHVEEIDREINAALQGLGRLLNADRSYIFLFAEDRTVLNNSHEWCHTGIAPRMDHLQGLPSSSFPWWFARLSKFEDICIPRVADIPPEGAAEKGILQAQGIQSLLLVPLVKGEKLAGFLGLDAVGHSKAWQPDEVSCLKFVGGIFANALERQHHSRLQAVAYEIGRASLGVDNPENLFALIHENLRTIIVTHNFYIALIEPDRDLLACPYQVDENQPTEKAFDTQRTRPLEDGVTEYVIRGGQTALFSAADLMALEQAGALKLKGPHPAVWLGSPLRNGEKTIGLIAVQSYDRPHLYSRTEFDLLEFVSGPIAAAIENVRLLEASQRRLRELETIATVSLAVRVAGSRQEIIATILAQLEALLKVNGGAYTVRSPEHREIRVEVASGLWQTRVGNLIPADNSISAEVLRTGQLYVENSAHSEPRLPSSILQGIQAVACVPLITQKQISGLIWVGRNIPFLPDEARLLGAIGDIAATALHRNALFEDARRRLNENRLLAVISRKLNQTFDLGQILQLIVDSAQELLPYASRVIFHAYDPEQEFLSPVAISTASSSSRTSLGMHRGEGIAGRALAQGVVIRVNDTGLDPHYLPGSSTAIRSLIAVPVSIETRSLGTISIQSEQAYAFTPADENLLVELSSRAAVAIENARLYQAESDQRQFSEALARAALALNQSLHLDQVLDEILRQIRTVVPCQAANIMFIEADGQARIVRHLGYEGMANLLAQLENTRFPLTWPYFQQMLAHGRPVFVADTEIDRDYQPTPGAHWVRSFISVPLRVGGETLGFLNVSSDEPAYFGTEAPARLQVMAAQAASAIQNARLLAGSEAALQQEQATRDQLVQAGKLAALGRMVASVAHELNNPIQTIKNTIYLLRQSIAPASSDNEFVEIAISEIDRVSGLVALLRDAYRPRGNLTLQKVDLVLLLDDVIQLISPHLERHRVTCSPEITLPQCLVRGFPDQIKQVFLNISLNAIEAMQPSGGCLSIRLFLDEAGRKAGIEFKDTGAGIATQDFPHIFDPFYSTKDTGTGLGLAISYDIIQRHGGEITVTSVVNAGSTFVVWLHLISIATEAGEAYD